MSAKSPSRSSRPVTAPLTVRRLTEIPYLETRLQVGSGGADTAISWAHATELPRPWEWLERGDLLMTIGVGLPSDPAMQVTYVENLAKIGVSGIALGEGFPLPPLSEQMVDAAERCCMPILYVGWNVPFAQVSRAVAAANYGPQLGRLVQATRVYDLVRSSVASSSQPQDLFLRLEAEIGCSIHISTDRGVRIGVGEGNEPTAAVRETFLSALEEHKEGKMPRFLRLAAGDETVLVVPIPTQRPTYLLAVPRDELPPFALLQHVATVAALELERMWAGQEEKRRLGGETLAQLMEGRLIQGTAKALEQLGLGNSPLQMLAIAGEQQDTETNTDLHTLFAEERIPHLLLDRDGITFALIGTEGVDISAMPSLLPFGLLVGASKGFDDPANAATAAQEAKWSLSSATPERPFIVHGEVSSLFGPRSSAEAKITVQRVLGPVIEYDAEHNTELMRSLQSFLQSDRSWKRATNSLFIHKQTLVYRIRSIEKLTGRKLNNTSHVAEIWVALRAWEMLS